MTKHRQIKSEVSKLRRRVGPKRPKRWLRVLLEPTDIDPDAPRWPADCVLWEDTVHRVRPPVTPKQLREAIADEDCALSVRVLVAPPPTQWRAEALAEFALAEERRRQREDKSARVPALPGTSWREKPFVSPTTQEVPEEKPQILAIRSLSPFKGAK